MPLFALNIANSERRTPYTLTMNFGDLTSIPKFYLPQFTSSLEEDCFIEKYEIIDTAQSGSPSQLLIGGPMENGYMIVIPVDAFIHKVYEFFVKVYDKGGMTFISDK